MLCLLLSVFDIMAGVRAVPYFNNLDGVSKGGRGPLLQDARVDQSNVWAEFGPCRGLHIGGAEGIGEGLGNSFRQVGSCASIHDSGVSSKESSADALPDCLDSCVMPGNVVSQEGRASRQDVASPVLCSSANGAVVIGGRVGVSCIWHLPSVGQLLVPEFAPSGPVHLHFERPGDGGSGPKMVASLWEDLGVGFKPHGGIDTCEVFVGGV